MWDVNSKVVHIVWNEQFKAEALEFKWVVLVDFWAEWCGPCQMIWPVLDELSNDYDWQNVKIIKINVDEAANSEIASKFSVVSIPAIILHDSTCFPPHIID